jgi:hypothetical protein
MSEGTSNEGAAAARRPKWAFILIGATFGVCVAALSLARAVVFPGGDRPFIFSYLFWRDEPSAAVLTLGIAAFRCCRFVACSQSAAAGSSLRSPGIPAPSSPRPRW